MEPPLHKLLDRKFRISPPCPPIIGLVKIIDVVHAVAPSVNYLPGLQDFRSLPSNNSSGPCRSPLRKILARKFRFFAPCPPIIGLVHVVNVVGDGSMGVTWSDIQLLKNWWLQLPMLRMDENESEWWLELVVEGRALRWGRHRVGWEIKRGTGCLGSTQIGPRDWKMEKWGDGVMGKTRIIWTKKIQRLGKFMR